MQTLDSEQVPDDRLGEVLAAYLEAVDAGWAPDRRAFLFRYPQWRQELDAFFTTQDEVRTLSQPFRPLTHSMSGQTPLPHTLGAVASSDPNATLGVESDGDARDPTPSFGDFEVLQEIARGGMGVVYRAKQRSLNRLVALKMILAGRLASTADVQRFRNEAESAALMDHPGIVPIYDVGEQQGQPWFSMKLIEGGSLAEQMPRFAVDPRAAASFLIEVARAVHYAHQRGILHRDLKPANILIDEKGRPLVTDFGLAKRFEGDAGLTQSNAIVGTPSYMAPEQALGKHGGLTTAADVYSLGAILYEMLTSRPPFKADNPLETLLQLREQPPIPPRMLNPRIDRDLELICLKCLEKEPTRRYSTAADLADELERWLDGKPIVCRRLGVTERLLKWVRRRPALAVMAGLSVLVVVLGLFGLGVLSQLNTVERAWQEEAKHARNESQLREQEDKARREAVAALRQAEQQKLLAESTLCVNRVMRAYFEWQDNEVARADQILDECPEPVRNWEWFYVKRLCHSEQLTLKHPSRASSVAFGPDGKQLASASTGAHSSVKVWDAHSGRETLTLKGGISVAFSPDGQCLAGAGGDGTVKVWDVHTGQETHTLKGHTQHVSSVAFSPDGQRLASAGDDGMVKVWDVRTGKAVLTLKGHTLHVSSVAFSPDSHLLASAGGTRQ